MWAVLLLIAALLVPSFAAAEDSVSGPGQRESFEAEEIAVTASRYREGIASSPSKVTVITEEEIRNSTARNIPDLLRTVASAHVNDIAGNQRYITVDLRGFGETGVLNTLVLVDGRRVNQADLSGTDWTLIPLERVKRIEILHGGGGGVLYGDNAAGGVIHIITKEAERTEAGVSAIAGSYDTYRGLAHVSGTWEGLALSFSAKYLSSDGYRDNSATEAADLGLKMSYYPTDSARVYLSGWFHRDDTGLPGAIKESDFAAGTGRRETVNPEDFAEVEDVFVKGGTEISFWEDSFFTLDMSYRSRDTSTFASFAGGNFTGDTLIDTVSISPQFVFRTLAGSHRNTLTLGFDYHGDEEDISNESLFFGETTSGDFDLEKDNYGLYAQDELELRNDLFLSGGYRYDRADFTFSPSTPGNVTMSENLFKAGINYVYSGKSYAYLGYNRSFRYPVLDEIFNFFTSTIDPGLKAQTTDDFEIGIRHYLSSRAYIHLNLFHSGTLDEIFFNPATFTNENLDGKALRKGVEISFDARALEWLAVNGSYAYLDATIDGGLFDGKEVPNVPTHKAALRAILSTGKGLSFILEGIYVGERPFISDFGNEFESQESYSLLNGKIEYRRTPFTAFLTVNNVTDRKYTEYGVLGGFPLEKAFFPSPERNITIGASLHW